jgi:NAD(P)-dependent dehydrogenase (short-subunit alcohol dehydrogenase family)
MTEGGLNTDLSGRVALVTGAGTGPGKCFALALALAGAAVVLGSRRLEVVQAAEAEITEAGGQALAVQLDVCNAASITAAVEAAEARFGIVDILVNNAAAAEKAWAVDLSLETVDEIIDTNLRGPFLLSVEVARRLIAAGRPGRIVNISSVGIYQYVPVPPLALYSATKAGLKRLTETLAIEWARHHINVNTIAPGLYHSEHADPHIAQHGEKILRAFPRKRFGQPEFMESTLLYLVSPSSHAVTGTCVIVDDGQATR